MSIDAQRLKPRLAMFSALCKGSGAEEPVHRMQSVVMR